MEFDKQACTVVWQDGYILMAKQVAHDGEAWNLYDKLIKEGFKPYFFFNSDATYEWEKKNA